MELEVCKRSHGLFHREGKGVRLGEKVADLESAFRQFEREKKAGKERQKRSRIRGECVGDVPGLA